MTSSEWNQIGDFLEIAEVGDFVVYEERKVEVVDMCGGRYLLNDGLGMVSGLVFDLWKAQQFLKSGKVFVR